MSIRTRATLLAVSILILSPAVLVAAQSPFFGTPFQLPTTIQAEDYDLGGEGVAYHDTSTGNVFAVYRADDIDVGAIPAGSGGGYHVGFLEPGEWVEYTVNVPVAPSFTVVMRVASNHIATSTFHVEIDGTDVSGTRSVASTGGWQVYSEITFPVTLPAGSGRVLRVSFDTGHWNLDRIEVRAQLPFGSGPVNLPSQTLQAENYDLGGQDLAYSDSTAGNVFGVYRNDDVDVGAIPGTSGGGYHVGNMASGEWTEYTVNVAQTQSYQVEMRVASANAFTSTFRVLLDGVDVSGSRSVAPTGGWHDYEIITFPLLGSIPAGNNRVLRLSFDTGAFNLDWLRLQGVSAAPDLTISRSDGAYRPPYTSLGNLNHIQRGTGARRTTFTLTNTGTASLRIDSATSTGAPVITVLPHDPANPQTTSDPLPRTLAPNGSARVVVNLDPPFTTGFHQATLRIQSLELGVEDVPLFAYITQGRYCDPGPLAEDFTRVLDGLESASTGCWNDRYITFQWNGTGGSQNKPVLASAIRLFALNEPAAAQFFLDYVNSALGASAPPRPEFRYLLLDELGAPGYDGVTITGILGARAWAHKNRASGYIPLEAATGKWLRAYFALASLATTPVPAAKVAPVSTFVDEGVQYSGYPASFLGPATVLAGQRSCPTNWGFTRRPRMLSLALGLGGNGQGTATYEAIWTRLEVTWNRPPVQSSNLYGLTPSEASQLRGVVGGGSCPATVRTSLAGIRTKGRIEIAGWGSAPGWGLVRASTSEAINMQNLFGEVLVSLPHDGFPANSVHVVYPWGDPPYGGCGGTGTAGGVELILKGDQRIDYTPAGATSPSISVDLPDGVPTFTFSIDSTGAIGGNCP
jgi:hypothetical protein